MNSECDPISSYLGESPTELEIFYLLILSVCTVELNEKPFRSCSLKYFA